MNYAKPLIFLVAWARSLKRETAACFLAAADRRTPFVAKALAVAIVSYALSPIDLIPDFIPVIGLFDELLLLPIGIWAVVRLIPHPLMMEFRHKAEAVGPLPASGLGAALVVAVWLAFAAIVLWSVAY